MYVPNNGQNPTVYTKIITVLEDIMHRPTTMVSLWMAATLLPSSNAVVNAEMMTTHHHHHHRVGTSSASLHKTWGTFIQRQSLTAQNENTLNVVVAARRRSSSSASSLSPKLACFTPRKSSSQQIINIEWSLAAGQIITKLRGGASDDTTDEESSEEEEEEYDEEYESEYEDESEEEDEGKSDNIVSSLTSTSLKSSLRSKSSSSFSQGKQQIQQYDDVLTPPAMQQLVISLGVMFLSQRIDILDEKTVRIARFAFVSYIVMMQLFLLYVRFRVKAINDRTEITLSNPLASLVQGATGGAMMGGGGGGGGGNFMVKALADQMLSSTTTIYEYDLSQAKKMNSGLLMPMIFLYFLHFKMKQVQPLLMQTATGVMNLVYSPLFQVYVLGRNLERPFKPPGNPMMEALQKEEESSSSSSSDEKGVEEVVEDDAGADVNNNDDDEEEPTDLEEDEGEESDVGDEESDGNESEYDTEEE